MMPTPTTPVSVGYPFEVYIVSSNWSVVQATARALGDEGVWRGLLCVDGRRVGVVRVSAEVAEKIRGITLPGTEKEIFEWSGPGLQNWGPKLVEVKIKS